MTYQTDANGQPVTKILVESCTDIAKELYLGAVVDRGSRRVVFMASTEGGVEIEKVAHETPELIHKAAIDPLVGPQPYQARELAFKLGLVGDQIKQFTKIFMGLGQMFLDCDFALLEINPWSSPTRATCTASTARSTSTPTPCTVSPSCARCTIRPRMTPAKRTPPSGS